MNLVLIIVDTLRRDHVGVYGNDWISTPSLDGLAAESIRFTNAYPEALPTIEARQSIYTGNRLFPFRDHQSRKGDNVRWPGWHPIRESEITLAEIMSHAGCRTGLVTDVYHQFKPAMNFHRGFQQFAFIRGQEGDAYVSSARMTGVDISHYLHPSLAGTAREASHRRYLANVADRHYEEDYFAPKVFREAMRFVEDNRNDDFCLVVDCFDPHEPWDPPRWYWELYDPGYEGQDLIWPPYGPTDDLTRAEIDHIRALFAGEVTMVDKWLGLFVEKMRALRLLDDTLVMVVSDHGHSLGEHNVIGKLSQCQYPELVDIIFMIREPGGEGAGRVIDEFVYDHDILPTALARLEIDLPRPVDGTDLWPLIRGEASGRAYVTGSMGEYARYQDETYRFICRFDGGERQLFVPGDDPELASNLAEKMPDVCEELFGRIREDAGGDLPVISPESLRRAGPWYEQV
jgi:arylsulfatase A-like enzyme